MFLPYTFFLSIVSLSPSPNLYKMNLFIITRRSQIKGTKVLENIEKLENLKMKLYNVNITKIRTEQ